MIAILLWGCKKENITTNTDLANFDCGNTELRTVKDYEDCFPENNFLGVCHTYELSETVPLDAEDFNWLPILCADRSFITYQNSRGDTRRLEVIGKDRFIHQTRDLLNCSQSIEHTNIVCQKNEKIRVEFWNTDLFGPDTLRMELSHFINQTVNDLPADPFLRMLLAQQRSNTNIANFYFSADTEARGYDGSSRTFHPGITLLGEMYSDVIEFKTRRNVHAEPHLRFYLKEHYGLLGFEVDGVVWVQQ